MDERVDRRPAARRSLWYLVSYLTVLGCGLLAWPRQTLIHLGAIGSYDDVFPRVAGMFLLGLAMIAGAIMYHRLDVLYPGVVLVRAFFSICFLFFFASSRDPVFLAFFAIVFAGVGLTSAALWLDWRRGSA